jgi:hypothetical protein
MRPRHVLALRPVPPVPVFDWEADEDGPLTALDIEVGLAALDQHTTQPVRDFGRKLRRDLAAAEPARVALRVALDRDPSLRQILTPDAIAWAGAR